MSDEPIKFWRQVNKNGPVPSHNPYLGQCWLWTGCLHKRKFYGSYWDGTKTIGAHRQSYILAKGEIPKGLIVCHHCDNPSCVNPNHLFVGTYSDNNKDKTAKGRHHNTQKTHCKYGHELTPENLLPSNRNERICKLCVKRRTADYYSSKARTIIILESFSQTNNI